MKSQHLSDNNQCPLAIKIEFECWYCFIFREKMHIYTNSCPLVLHTAWGTQQFLIIYNLDYFFLKTNFSNIINIIKSSRNYIYKDNLTQKIIHIIRISFHKCWQPEITFSDSEAYHCKLLVLYPSNVDLFKMWVPSYLCCYIFKTIILTRAIPITFHHI